MFEAIESKDEQSATTEQQTKTAAAAKQTETSQTTTTSDQPSMQSTTSTESDTKQTAPTESVQAGIEGIIAQSPTAQATDQIVAVVAAGASANVYQKGDQWQTILNSGGMVGSEGVGQASESRSATPKGSYGLGFVIGTSNPGTLLPFKPSLQTVTGFQMSMTHSIIRGRNEALLIRQMNI